MKTDRFLSLAAIFAVISVSSISADTIYLRNGQEVKDAAVTEIGVSDVKYKVGKKTVIYTVKKSDIAIIFYDDGTKEVFEAESKSDATTGQNIQIIQNTQQNTQQTTQNTANAGTSTPNAESKDRYENFTTGQRWGTWALNALTINGLGSWLIMGDTKGGFVHLGLGVAWVVAALNMVEEEYVCTNGYNDYYGYSSSSCRDEVNTNDAWVTVYVISLISSGIWNIYRSISYDKPNPHASLLDPGNFNFAVLPNRKGNGMAYGLRYSLEF